MANASRSAEGPAQIALASALIAFLLSNLIHNDFGLDVAVVPAATFGALFAWRRARPLLWATALFVALPALSFLRPTALTQTADLKVFFNHWALLVAGGLAIVGVLLSLTPRRPNMENG